MALPPTESSYILQGAALPQEFTPSDPGPGASLPTRSGGEEASPDRGLEIPEEKGGYKTNSIAYTTANCINAIVGSGIMGMPFALRQSGLIVGLVFMAVVAVITDHSLVLLVAAGRATGADTYQECLEALFGKTGFYVAGIMQFMVAFIALISYDIIAADTLTKVLTRMTSEAANSAWLRREVVAVLATLTIVVPLSLFSNVAHLSKASSLSVALIVFIAFAMLVRAPHMAQLTGELVQPVSLASSNVGPGIAIMSFAFVCHHCSFFMYKSLSNRTQARWNKTVHISLTTASLLCVVIALAGYIPFTNLSQGDILENYCWSDDLMNVCRAMFAFAVLLTFPIECFASRDVILTTFFRHSAVQPVWRHVALTLAVIVAALLFSFTTDCLGLVLQLNGIFLACPIAFIIPGVCYIKSTGGPLFTKDTITAWVIIAFGAVSALLGFVTILYNLDTIGHCSHGQEMPYCPHFTDYSSLRNSSNLSESVTKLSDKYSSPSDISDFDKLRSFGNLSNTRNLGDNYSNLGDTYSNLGDTYSNLGDNYSSRGDNYSSRGDNYSSRGDNNSNLGDNYSNLSVFSDIRNPSSYSRGHDDSHPAFYFNTPTANGTPHPIR